MTDLQPPRAPEGWDVVVAHDYLTQRGGAERVVLELADAFRPRKLLTSLYLPDATYAEFGRYKVEAGLLNHLGVFRRDPRKALPFLAAAWSRRRPIVADAVVCSSSGWSHGVRTSGRTRKIVYCHNPPRWLYQPEDYLAGSSRFVRAALALLRPALLRWDQKAAASVDVYVANSSSVAERIRAAYHREPLIVFPPISVDAAGEQAPVPGLDAPFFLTVGRERSYKGTQTLVEAFARMPDQQLAVVGTKPGEAYPANVRPLGRVSEAQLRWLYGNARALVSVSREDFGLTPIEANAFGTPVLLVRAGGFLDSTDEGVSGHFIDDASADAVERAVRAFPGQWDREAIRRHAQRFDRKAFQARMIQIVADVL